MNTMTSNTNNAFTSTTSEVTTPPPATPPAATAKSGKARLRKGFLHRDSNALLIVDSQHIIVSMTGNKAYPDPVPTLADIAAARAAFIAGVNAAKDSRLAMSARDDARVVLVGQLSDLALYVQATSGGDRTTLQSSGFPIQQARVPVGQLPAPANVRVVRGKISGQIVARCRPVPRASAYQWRCAPTATPTVWLPIVTTFAANHSFEGLPALTSYSVQVCVVGKLGPSNWSDAVTVAVL